MGSQQVETSSQSAAAAAAGGAPLKVAIVGFGTVGRSVAKVLSSGIHPSLQLTAICNRGVERKKVDWVPAGVDWTDSIDAVIASDADIVVELMGGLEPAGDLIRRALKAGKSVVTANKQLISTHGVELLALARAAAARAAVRGVGGRRHSDRARRAEKGSRAIGCCAWRAS